ncbi:hypothetical protein XELAEV_18043913mg [Xenopus laevis]|uniref:Uncharacterized protein n=1 Tax=Xenopus laevis TaxID=8355 RepID=A0A974H2U0_XENLA|nr:hypothetical protein XELAEV_18043913mg [Xenopus laevis]
MVVSPKAIGSKTKGIRRSICYIYTFWPTTRQTSHNQGDHTFWPSKRWERWQYDESGPTSKLKGRAIGLLVFLLF